ncbi:MAG: DUF2520 domain-containing protein [Legionellaceae bacterium]|nr:DUF2520 domain-containing protein [Legionellaceae bacterium]
MALQMNIIGSGNVGRTLANLFVDNQLLNISGVYNRTEKHAREAIEFIGDGYFVANIVDLPHADITIITTTDDNITTSAKELSLNENIRPGDIIAHCSGVLSSGSLDSLKNKGCMVASVHPMRSFINPMISVKEYPGTYCAIEGDKMALDVLEPLFTSIGSKLYAVNHENKALYHAAGVFASNYLLTISKQALDCLEEAGVEKDVALPVIVNLMRSTLTNLENTKSPEGALTGPIKRGDSVTINKHLAAFTNEKQRDLYAILAEATKELI